ncbi:MAG: Flp pilus assembly complex ATPase component TadA [Firmicutes bacterium]|nr:Flp pilus assembly complex ATPase component TadA [Bacillota bacterium]MBV1728386.1 Flp pilus assembly complex ATPase component TadA [Desulforudis sp.]MBU4532660.1 Flp pilus assembly complex ATPase component TadA [Bacillota bacterium]MBU4553872.1 Flp pilus assembly complex ATPase component TadA [Bacillota bacterium]MBV1734583.1 Flp pilus assembly complex ATPase component TadA [Desulforudis sp.]
MANNQKPRLGDLFVQAGAITQEQLKQALDIQKRTGVRLGEVLVNEKFISQNQLTAVLEGHLGIRSIDLRRAPLDSEAANRVPENLARRHVLIPVQVADGKLLVAMKDPLDWVAIQDVRLIAGTAVTPLVASERDIVEAIDRVFGQQRVADQAAEDIARAAIQVAGDEVAAAAAAVALDVESAPMVRLVNSIIENAARSRASDIHIEPKPAKLQIRTRVDGVLHEVLATDIRVHSSVVSRIKVMANMNIAEKRLPQDGKVAVLVDNRKIDLRVSSMPTTYGEKVVIRVLDRGSFLVGKEHLGLSDADKERFNRLAGRPYGIILVTGPTGSGKTTSLYSMLSELDAKHKNIVTLEDPVEYDMEGISQTQINIQAGLTFASGLRTLLRQDPDTIMVGEIRDDETAEIAVRSALTGHLVLSTLHTNDAPSAVARIMDIGIQPYLVASALAGVIAQRLIRKVCPDCREEYEADARERELLDLSGDAPVTLVRGRGCTTCSATGYQGRTGVFEILEVDRDLRVMINKRVSTDELREVAVAHGMAPLWYDCRDKVLRGITSLEEALRVTQIY